MKYTPFFTAISRLLAVFLYCFLAIPHHLHSQGLFDDFQFIAHDSDISVPLLVADLEGDGDADFITATAFFLDTDYWCNIVWYENLGAGVFGTMKELYSYQGVPTISISIVDMDNDGDNDLLYSSDNIYWIAQSGSQVFEELHYIETGTYFKEFLPIDMDNDNDIDIMPVNTSGVNMIWFRNNLSDNWGLEIKNTLMNLGNHYITPCDFDQDGDVDFTCIAQTMAGPDLTYKKLIYKNNGAGSLQGIYAGGSNYSYQGLISTNGDIDNDGYTDYICSHQSDGKITWLQNNGLGNCNEEAVLLIEAGIKPISALSDLDGDEDLDLLLKSNEKGVIWFQNKNEGNFEWVEEIFAEPLQYIHTIDLDNDGDKEVIGLYWSDNNPQIGNGIVWFDNLNTQPSVKVFAFYDHNANGIKDENDFFVDNQLFTITPAASGFYSNTAGVSQFYLEEGNYTLHYNVPEAYHLSSDSTDYHFEMLPTNNAPLYYYFGITPNDTPKFSLSAFITASPLICNNEVAYQIIVRNQSAFPLDSILLQCNYASDLILSSSLPTTDSIENNQLFWDISQLLPFESKSIIVNFTVPNFNAMGDTLQVSAIPYFVNYDQKPPFNSSEIIEGNSDIYKDIVVCSYDPNDKSVQPQGQGTEHFTLLDACLKYTIRFQNTGNFTAKKVIIRDTLSYLLDWNTFEPLTASHEYKVERDLNNGIINFIFDNINLPDSSSNEIESQGFVFFKICPLADIPEHSIVNNSAAIYFDENPPVITNTTNNHFVSSIVGFHSLPMNEATSSIQVYFNSMNKYIYIADLPQEENYFYILYNAMGKIVQKGPLEKYQQPCIVDIANLPTASYYIAIYNKSYTTAYYSKILKF